MQNDYLFVAEFHKANDEGVINVKYRIPTKVNILVKMTSVVEPFYEDFRTATDFQGWFGTIDNIEYDLASNTSTMHVSYNNGRHSWDYDWKSNRWSGPETAHVITCYLFQVQDAQLSLIQQASSEQFKISCTHKHPIPKSAVCALSEMKSSKKPRLDDNASTSTHDSTQKLRSALAALRESEPDVDSEADASHNITSEYDDTDNGTTGDEEDIPFSIVDRSCYIFDMKRRLENAGYSLESNPNL
jgi:hypothetical protein